MRINYLAVICAALAHWLVGGLWYGALFGNKWIELMGGINRESLRFNNRAR